MQVRKQQLEQDMEQQTSSKLGKEYIKAVYCLYIVYCLFNWYAEYIMQNAGLDEAQAGIKIAGRVRQQARLSSCKLINEEGGLAYAKAGSSLREKYQ